MGNNLWPLRKHWARGFSGLPGGGPARGHQKGGEMPKVKLNRKDEIESLARLNEIFRDAMLKKLIEKQEEGYHGWSNKQEMNRLKGGLKVRIIHNALNEKWVNVANLAMFAWNFDE